MKRFGSHAPCLALCDTSLCNVFLTSVMDDIACTKTFFCVKLGSTYAGCCVLLR